MNAPKMHAPVDNKVTDVVISHGLVVLTGCAHTGVINTVDPIVS